MPYSGPSDANLPENVKSVSSNFRAMWVHIFNDTLKKTGDEAQAFKVANGTLKRKRSKDINSKEIVDALLGWNEDEGEGIEFAESEKVVIDALAESGAESELAEKMLSVALKDMIEHTPEGSFEHIRQMAHRALNPPYDPQQPFQNQQHLHIIGTYPNHILATSYGTEDGTGDTIHKIPYTYSSGKGLKLDTANAQRHKITITPADVDAAKKEIETSPVGVALKKVLDAADRNALPSSKFGYVDPSGKGHFPLNDEEHVRKAVQLLGTSPYGAKARSKVMAAARRFGIEVNGKKDFDVVDALGLNSPLEIFMASKDLDAVAGLRSSTGLRKLGVTTMPEEDADGDGDFDDGSQEGIGGDMSIPGGGTPTEHHFQFEREPDGTLRGWLKGLKDRGILGQKNSLSHLIAATKTSDGGSTSDASTQSGLALFGISDPAFALATKEYSQSGMFTSGQPGALMVCKDASGGMRFFAPYTNCYKDRHDEIMATAGHKWYAEWATENQKFPEMWLWHTKGTRWGECDSLDFIDGVMMASGTVDPGCENVALALAALGEDLGWSHGFVGLKTKEGVWTQYVDVEITALPHERAANPYTAPISIFQLAA